jgi:hypothetical protein
MIALGIDIGKTGALAAIDSHGICVLYDLPLREKGGRLCGHQLLRMLREVVPIGETATVVAEDVQARPQGNSNRHGNTMYSQGSMMESKGIILATLDIARLDVRLVTPQAWKAFYGLTGQDKNASMKLAQSLYPDADLRLVKHHNRAEALLMARYGLRKFT